VCGWASIHGYPIGILGNNGVIYPESAEKAAHFIQLCNQIDVPLLFLQNITGYMVGRDFEAAGIIKKGSQMINAVTNSTVPHLTVIIGSSYGAGTYGMSGRAFGNRFTFLWPTAKIAVMGPKQIAGVMSIVRRGQAARAGEPFDEEEDAKIVAMVEAIQEEGSLALEATGAISDDGIIDPRDTRTVLGLCLSVVRNRAVEGTEATGCSGCEQHGAGCATTASAGGGPPLPPTPPITARCVLVANRGEIARRIFRTAHHGDALHRRLRRRRRRRALRREADEAVRLPGATSTPDAIIDAARAPAPTPSTPATGSCPRTPPSPAR
jgi:hypothetical protein